jgi:putative ATPase
VTVTPGVEARITLAQAVTFVACAPKSNAAYNAINKAQDEVRSGPAREVPLPLRDPNMDAKERGHGQGYKYPHDFPGHWVEQAYMPAPVRFYEPTEEGDEKRIKQRLDALRERPR